MSAYVVVPAAKSLLAAFTAVAPRRDKGSDGTAGDPPHQSGGTSDHLPDEDYATLRGKDADNRNEVHAADIDSTGPWPGGPEWFDRAVHTIVDRHRDGHDDRLQYVIWNRKIANRDIDNWRWRDYHGTADDHTGHAHFSIRYTTAAENDTRPWGFETQGDDMSVQDVRDFFESAADGVLAGDKATVENRADRNRLAAVLRYAFGLNADDQAPEKLSANLPSNRMKGIQSALVTIADKIDAAPSGPGGGSGVTLEQVTDAVHDGVRAVLRNGVGTD